MQTIPALRLAALLCAHLLALVFFCALAFTSYQAFLKTRSALAFGLLVVDTLFLILFLFRRKAVAVSGSPMAWLLGFSCALLPMLLRPDDTALSAGVASVGDWLQLLGAGLIVAALLSLRRSFGIVAAHRGIKTGGLYRWVRHPLYAAELLFMLGFTLAHASAWNAFIWVLVAGFQGLRAHLEERFLAHDAVYRAYRRRCPHRFVPGVW
jgi:protein-S-isoprenylcysteine O-methyltransferase Ste14